MNGGRAADVVYFAPDFTETSTVKRIESFIDNGLAPLLVGFDRSRYNLAFKPAWPYRVLGRTADNRYLARLVAVAGAVPKLFGMRDALRGARVFYARNVDQLVLALAMKAALKARAAVVYEVLDVQPALTGNSVVSRLLRAVEKACLSRIDLLVVSSPGFHRNYYQAVQGYRGRWFLLENKLHSSSLALCGWRPQSAAQQNVAPQANRKWRVGYFGLIRGEATLDLIARLASRLRDKVHFEFRGILTTVPRERFEAVLARNENITYGGEYANPCDLAELYGGVDLTWALDLENIATNSRWLLPCRFYESGLFGVPCLAARGFEVGNKVDGLGAGWTFEEPLEEGLVRFFANLNAREYEMKRQRLLELPLSSFVADDDAAKLCRLMTELSDRTAERVARSGFIWRKAVQPSEPS